MGVYSFVGGEKNFSKYCKICILNLSMALVARNGNYHRIPRKHYIILILAIIGIISGLVIMGLFWGEQDEDEHNVCGETCHESQSQAYNNSGNNSFMAPHINGELACLDCHSDGDEAVINETHHEVIPSENCLNSCHEHMDWQMEAPPMRIISNHTGSIGGGDKTRTIWHPHTENGTFIEGLRELDSCTNCHDPRVNTTGIRAAGCVICHDITPSEMEQHAKDTCALLSCHPESSEHEIEKSGHLQVDVHCNECHNGSHDEDPLVAYNLDLEAGPFTVNSSFCSTCHRIAAGVLDDAASTHQEEGCIKCHQEHDGSTECIVCHSESSINHPTGRAYGDCTSCHVQGGHDPKSIEFPILKSQDLSVSFCSDQSCHQDNVYSVVNEKLDEKLHGREGFVEDCLSCHDTHSEEVDCFSCHDSNTEPDHDILAPYDECSLCHVDGHDNENITFTGLGTLPVERGFCDSCHQEGIGAGPITYGSLTGKHTRYGDGCTNECHTDHLARITCTSDGCHIDSLDPVSHEDSSDKCYSCHNSAHDPIGSNPNPGSNLSQKDYFDGYWTLSAYSTYETFSWNSRGNHTEGQSCVLCHPTPETTMYPDSTLSLLNMSGTACTTECHDWTDEDTIERPHELLASSNTLHNTEIFENASRGGCTGYCHQEDPDNPILNGSGHKVINNCLDSQCHGEDFIQSGQLHLDHGQGLEDANVNCYDTCHTYYTTNHQDCNTCHEQHAESGEDTLSLEPIDGGCYGCHRSGHDPSLLPENPCTECHE